jgi:hypothetical protein
MLSRRLRPLAGLATLARLVTAVVCAGALGGCGGKLDQGTPAVPSTALRSFVGTVTDAKIVESWNPGGSLGAISVGQTARIDVRIDAAGQVELVAITSFGEAVRATGTRGATTAVDIPQVGDFVSSGLSFHGTSGGWQVDETYAHFEIAFDEAGVPRSLTATGQASAFAGDVGTSGTATATITLAADAVAPTWRASAAASFANRALPWDARTVEASEPYEGQADFATLFPGAARADFDVTPFATAAAWGAPATTRERGVTLVAKRWDAVAALRARGAPVVDVAGNVALAAELPFDGIGVDSMAASSLPAGAAGGRPWGDVKGQSDCGDGKPCLVVGPFQQSYCGGGSAGGVAARLRGAGHATFRVRITAKSDFGGGPAGQNVLHVLATNPGSKPATDTLAFPTTASADGTYDTGWKTITVTTPNATASETGVAVGAGGVGSAPVSANCGPAPSPAAVTVYIGEVAIAP